MNNIGRNMNHPLVSVVVPVYKVEKYLDRCINSIVNQTYGNLEIILVDDGSPDRCPEMCEEWAKKDVRIKVVHKENQGLGMARNTGIVHATGKYIYFCDSDDYLALNLVEKTVAAAEKNNADTVLFGHCSVEADGTIAASYIPDTDKDVYRGEEVLNYVLPNLIAPSPLTGRQTNLCMSAWVALFSLEMIKMSNWQFVSEREIISEDSYSLLLLYKEVACTVILPESLYFYCRNDSSLTHMFREDRYKKIVVYHRAIMAACQQAKYGEIIVHRFHSVFFSFSISAMKMIAAAELPVSQRYTMLKSIVNDRYMQDVMRLILHDRDKPARVILKWLIRLRMTWACYLLVAMKARM